MLLQFNFKNFKSFKDDVSLDLTATKTTEYHHHVVSIANEKILPVTAIYGANASGKSNVKNAFRYMSTYVVRSLYYGDETRRMTKTKNVRYQPTPFLFDSQSKYEPSSFEVYFITPEEDGAKTYQYGFSVNQNGIVEEWLNYKAKTAKEFKSIFYRSTDELDLSGLPSKCHENIRIALEKETLVVSLGAKLKVEKLKLISDWFYNNEIADFGEPVENLVLSGMLPEGFSKDKAIRDNVIKYFSAFDPSIIDFRVETIKGEAEGDREKFRIEAIHQMIGSEETAAIPLKQESAGTLKMFAMYPMLHEVMQNGGVLFVDELNARLHPLLVRAIIATFINSEINTHHAQLIFTTHDSWQLNSSILRRDEIWFTQKDRSGISSLYSLSDFVSDDGTRIRKDENYEKNYLLGKYGAIPELDFFDMLSEGFQNV